jgi:hypothetical protein
VTRLNIGMIPFNEYFLLMEAKFSQSKKIIPIAKSPMFSIYLFRDDVDKVDDMNELKEKMVNACTEARKIITKMGFPSMHSNILLKDLSKEVNWVTGGGVGGYAKRKGKYMEISLNQINSPNYLIRLIVHEWAHLWMFNNSKGFKNAVKEYYNTLLKQYKDHVSTSQKQSEKLLFKDINKIKFHDKVEEILGRDYSDRIYTEIVKEMMGTVKDIYYGYIYNRYAEDDYPFKEDEQTFFKNVRESYIKKTESMILKIVDDIVESGYYPNMQTAKKQIRYLSNAIWKIYYSGVLKKIVYSVESDEIDFKWAKEDGEEWASRVKSPLNYLEGLTNNNKNFVFDKKTHYNDLHNKFSEFVNNYDPPTMIINLIYGIFENAITRKIFPQAEDKLVGEDKSTYREEMKDLVKWVNSYGVANDDELWATGVEKFIHLPPNHRKAILNLMTDR